MRIAICDDEKNIRELIGNKVAKQYPKAEIVFFSSGEELLLSDKHTANKELEAAAKADQQAEKTDDKDKKTDKKDAVSNENEDTTVVGTKEAEIAGAGVGAETVSADVAEPVEVSVPKTVVYNHVDVRL